MKIEKDIEVFGWKHCVKLSSADVEMVVTTDVGPRIISLTKNGGKNHMCVFNETMGKTGGSGFIPYGGHRVWHAPEEPIRTYFPDNSTCEVAFGEDEVSFYSFEKETNLKKGFNVKMDDSGIITVTNFIKNEGYFDVELAIWCLTQLENSGMLVIPTSRLDTGLVANRAISLWPYSKMTDNRVYFGDKFITLSPSKTAETPFKVGVTCDEQYAAYFNFNQLLLKKFDYYYDADYPNYSCNFETYTNRDFIEFESLSPMFTLEAGEMETHAEVWQLFDNVKMPSRDAENDIDDILSPLVNKDN